MEKLQDDTLNMFQTTHEVLDDHAADYAGNVPFEQSVTDLNDGIDSIELLRDQQEEDTTGVTQDKEGRREKLEQDTLKIGSVIAFYASTVNNRKLMQKVNFTKTDLSKARDNELPGMSEQVHQAAVDNAAAILPFGITGSMTTGLASKLVDYIEYISKPRAARSETSAATSQLPAAFDAVNKLLEERIDRGMELFRLDNSDFFAAYTSARIIVNSPRLKRSLEVTFVDSVTQKSIEHVRVLVDGTIKRRSSKKGNIRVQSLIEGLHAITGTLPGYNAISQNFNVISGETTKLIIVMVKV